MLLAEEYELVGLFVTSKEMVPIRQSIIKIGWLQPRLPVQTNKSTASGVTNNTIIPKQKKWWAWDSTVSNYGNPKSNSDIIGIVARTSRSTTASSTIQTRTMRHIDPCMLDK